MGTFHDDRGELHGITVVAEAGDTVYVGRCDTVDGAGVVLLDADRHTEGEDGTSNADWLQRAARFGVWSRLPRVTVPHAELGAVAPLGDYVRKGAEALAGAARAATAAEPAPAPAPAAASPADTGAVVTVTDAAADEVRRLLAAEENAGKGLRLGVAGGGCSGLVYKVEFDARRDGDVVVPCEGFDVLLDKKSTIYLRGTTLHFKASLVGGGFVFENPNASNTCGCGESFAV